MGTYETQTTSRCFEKTVWIERRMVALMGGMGCVWKGILGQDVGR
jgi:hypothetical protein